MPARTEKVLLNSRKCKGKEEVWSLRLYVAGQTPKSLAAFANLKNICEEKLAGKYSIEIIDLWKTPSWPGEIKFLPSRRWSGSSLRRLKKLSGPL